MEDSQTQLPWLDEPLPLDEAVETLAHAYNEEAEDTDALHERIDDISERLEGLEQQVDELEGQVEASDGDSESAPEGIRERVEHLEQCVATSNDATDATCPDCEEDDQVLKAGVAAAVLLENDALSDTNVEALNQESHLCLSCRKAFTPCEVGPTT